MLSEEEKEVSKIQTLINKKIDREIGLTPKRTNADKEASSSLHKLKT